MRPPKILGLLAATVLLVGSACGTAAPERKVRAAPPAAFSAPWNGYSGPTTSTTSTAPPTTTTTTPRPAPRPARARPTQQPAPPPAGGCMANRAKTVAEAHACWDGLIASYPWNTTTAFRIMYCESKGNPHAVGIPTRWGRAQGLFQILPGGSFDPATNAQQAWAKYQARGWAPWVCR